MRCTAMSLESLQTASADPDSYSCMLTSAVNAWRVLPSGGKVPEDTLDNMSERKQYMKSVQKVVQVSNCRMLVELETLFFSDNSFILEVAY